MTPPPDDDDDDDDSSDSGDTETLQHVGYDGDCLRLFRFESDGIFVSLHEGVRSDGF